MELLQRALIAVCLLLVASCGGGNTDNQPQSNSSGNGGSSVVSSDAFPATSISAHNASQVPSAVPLSSNLVSNGSFESSTDAWDLCGTGQILNTPNDAGAGERFLQLDTSALCDRFGQSILENSHGWAYRPINLTSVPDVLHLSLLARSSTPIELFENAFAVRLMASDDRSDLFARREATFLNSVDRAIDSSWTRVKLSITREDIEEQIGDLIPQWLIVEAIGPGNDTVVGIDDIRLTTQAEPVQPSPIPDSLIRSAAANRLVAYDLDNNRLVTMLGDGSSLHRYNLSTEFLVSFPTFAGANSILFSDRRFDPLSTSNAFVISGAGSNIVRSDLPSNQMIISEQPGTPGYYEFAGSVNNRDAIDITVRSIAWDNANDRGINGVCAQNRSLGGVSDSVCLLQLIDSNGNTTLTDIDATTAAFSPDGSKVAYVASDGKSVFTGTLNGQAISAQLSYESRADLNDYVSFSPDGRSLLLSSNSAAKIYISEDKTLYPSVLKQLDLSSLEIKSLLLADHGELFNNYTYSANGEFVYYSIELANGKIQVWWLELASGKTGPLVNTFQSMGVARR